MEEAKKVILSGIQPSGNVTLGNYLGALKNWALLQDDYTALYMIANMHAITVRQDAAELRRRSIEMLAILLSCGIDAKRSVLFVQSQVPEHTMLTWALSCNTYMGELMRMTQFKDKSASHADNVNAGLFTYPVLMAADILLYQADLVPVGADQKQHVELTRVLATRFNNAYGETFVVPEPYIPKLGARVMSLQEPTKKMSKSDSNPNAYILVLDEPDVIVRKFRRAVTDCEAQIAFDPQSRAGVSNLLSIYSVCADCSMEKTLAHFEGQNYGTLKQETADAVIALLEPLQSAYKRYMGDKTFLGDTMKEGADKARGIAVRTVRKVYHKLGFDCVK